MNETSNSSTAGHSLTRSPFEAYFPDHVYTIDPRELTALEFFLEQKKQHARRKTVATVVCLDARQLPFEEIEAWLVSFDVHWYEEASKIPVALPTPHRVIFFTSGIEISPEWADRPGVEWIADDDSDDSLVDRYRELYIRRLTDLGAAGTQTIRQEPLLPGKMGKASDAIPADQKGIWEARLDEIKFTSDDRNDASPPS